jgi:hypothetical protein
VRGLESKINLFAGYVMHFLSHSGETRCLGKDRTFWCFQTRSGKNRGTEKTRIVVVPMIRRHSLLTDHSTLGENAMRDIYAICNACAKLISEEVSITWIILGLSSLVVTICTTRFNIHKFYVLPTECVYVFCMDLRTNSDYFPIQH